MSCEWLITMITMIQDLGHCEELLFLIAGLIYEHVHALLQVNAVETLKLFVPSCIRVISTVLEGTVYIRI